MLKEKVAANEHFDEICLNIETPYLYYIQVIPILSRYLTFGLSLVTYMSHYAMKRKFLFTPYIIFAAAWWMNGAAWDYLKMKKI